MFHVACLDLGRFPCMGHAHRHVCNMHAIGNYGLCCYGNWGRCGLDGCVLIIWLVYSHACMQVVHSYTCDMCTGTYIINVTDHYVKVLINLLYYIWFKHCINNPLLEFQLSLWDLIWYMHVTIMSHNGHIYTMHVNITVTCMSPQHSCYMHVPCILPLL